jgi:hypothetical protein
MIRINQEEYDPKTICTAIKNFIAVYESTTDWELADSVIRLYALDDIEHKKQLYDIQLCEDYAYGPDSCYLFAIVCYDDDGKMCALDYIFRTKSVIELLSYISHLSP